MRIFREKYIKILFTVEEVEALLLREAADIVRGRPTNCVPVIKYGSDKKLHLTRYQLTIHGESDGNRSKEVKR